MNLKTLDLPFHRELPGLLTLGQITVDDIYKLAKAGVKSLVFNRPDAEEENQPSLASLKQAAETLGIEFHHQPVNSGQVTLEEGQEFGRIYQKLPQPLVAFCRTGARCGCLWALSQLGEQSATSLISQLKAAGFEMPDFFSQLQGLE